MSTAGNGAGQFLEFPSRLFLVRPGKRGKMLFQQRRSAFHCFFYVLLPVGHCTSRIAVRPGPGKYPRGIGLQSGQYCYHSRMPAPKAENPPRHARFLDLCLLYGRVPRPSLLKGGESQFSFEDHPLSSA